MTFDVGYQQDSRDHLFWRGEERRGEKLPSIPLGASKRRSYSCWYPVTLALYLVLVIRKCLVRMLCCSGENKTSTTLPWEKLLGSLLLWHCWSDHLGNSIWGNFTLGHPTLYGRLELLVATIRRSETRGSLNSPGQCDTLYSCFAFNLCWNLLSGRNQITTWCILRGRGRRHQLIWDLLYNFTQIEFSINEFSPTIGNFSHRGEAENKHVTCMTHEPTWL